MKHFSIIYLLLLTSSFLLAQETNFVRDVSPDGQTVSEYSPALENSPGKAFNRGDVPLPDQPDWQATLERQIGGLVWGDYNGDGLLDLAVGCYFSQSYPPINDFENQVYENIGGTLSASPAWSSSDMKSTTDVRWADVNGDGFLDLYASNGDYSLVPSVIYMNSAQGLSTLPGWTAADNTWSLGAAFADYDGDGDLDLAVANQGETVVPTRPIYIFENNGSALGVQPGWQSADDMISNTVAWGDLNNSDLVTDTLIVQGGGPAFMIPHIPLFSIDSVLLDGISTNEYCYDPISAWVSLNSYAAPDTNTIVSIFYTYMIKADMAASKWANYQSGVYMNMEAGLNTLPSWTVGNTESQKGSGWADYDLDGDLDLAIGASSAPTVLYENVNGTLSAQPVWSSNNSFHSTQDLIWGDVNRDGYPDLATVHFSNGHVRVYLNRQGVLDSTPSWYYDCSSSATAIAWGDVDSDGFLDLAVGTARQPIMVFINTSDTTTALPRVDEPVQTDFELMQNYPNPFNPETAIRFRQSAAGFVDLSIFNLMGQKVRTLVNGRLSEGEHKIKWDGRDDHGDQVATGVYVYRIEAGKFTQSRKMVLMK